MVTKSKFKKILLLLIVLFSLLSALFFFYTMDVIYRGVKSACLEAQKEYEEDCVNSLELVLTSDEKTFGQKNTAIWALGQLADKRALPLLERLYTGNIPKKESWDEVISQYELSKAIKWCRQGNISSWMYKNGFQSD
jgi:hypothetical protein